MTGKFSILEHPSDIGIEAEGTSPAEAFEAAARGLMSVILDPSTIVPREHRKVKIQASDREQLLVRWLSEILYLYDGQRFAPASFRISSFSPLALTAEVSGEPIDLARHRTLLDVKAVTYHQLAVDDVPKGVRLRVFLDI